MKRPSIFSVIGITLVSFVWLFCIWYWFVCKVKDFCFGVSVSNVETVEIQEPEILENVEKTPEQQAEEMLEELNASNEEMAIEELPVTSVEITNQNEIPKLGNIARDPNAHCKDLITQNIDLGRKNSAEEVKKLQEFLNGYEGENLNPDGKFKTVDREAVKRFQEKYRKDILDSAGIRNPTGAVYKSTIKKINSLYCNQ